MALGTRRRSSHLEEDDELSSLNSTQSSTNTQKPRSFPLRFFQTSISTLLSTFRSVTTFSPHYVPGSPYSTILHAKPWVYYRGTQTYVPISILGSQELVQEDRQIVLQKRGWRTGLLGWQLGALLGGLGKSKETNVTPQTVADWKTYSAKATARQDSGDATAPPPTLSRKAKAAYDAEIEEFLKGHILAPKDHHALETDLVRIPVSTGDGYFRLAVYAPKTFSRTLSSLSISSSEERKGKLVPIAHTSTFRVGSLSFASAQPRGASPLTLVPELLLRTVSLSAWGAFWALFPVFKMAQLVPGPSSRFGKWAIDQAWSRVGGDTKVDEIKDRWKVDERRRMAGEQFFRTMPFGTAGIRTDYDLRTDLEIGRGGLALSRS